MFDYGDSSDYGSNDELVYEVIKKIHDKYDEIRDIMGNGINDRFILPMQSNWASGKSKKFGERFANTLVCIFSTDSDSIYNKIRWIIDSINQVAIAYDQRNGNNTYISPGGGLQIIFPFSNWPEKFEDGFSGIRNSEEFLNNINTLKILITEIYGNLDELKMICSKKLFSTQDVNALIEAVNSIKNNLKKKIEDVITDLSNELINEEGSSKEFSDKVVRAFSGGSC